MNLKLALLLPGAIALGLATTPLPAVAQSDAFTPETTNPQINFKLNQQQQGAIQHISEFAFEQLEAILDGGLESGKVNPPQPSPQTEQMFRKFAASMRPDKKQVAELRYLLETARQQMKKQFDTGLPK